MQDKYALKARIYPVIILLLPILILGVSFSLESQSIRYILSSILLLGALTYLMSQLGRDKGKAKESQLWNKWGGPPTSQLLRLKDTRIDEFTKQRYHLKLREKCPTDQIPNLKLEEKNPKRADAIYRAWTKYLISQTRDIKKFDILFKDNISYGFRRNLWGLKNFALIIAILSILCNYIYWSVFTNNFALFSFQKEFYYSSFFLVIIPLFWLFIVTNEWVKTPAFSYAERLLESVELL